MIPCKFMRPEISEYFLEWRDPYSFEYKSRIWRHHIIGVIDFLNLFLKPLLGPLQIRLDMSKVIDS